MEMKADNSPLTRADQEANAVICQGLSCLGMLLLLLLLNDTEDGITLCVSCLYWNNLIQCL